MLKRNELSSHEKTWKKLTCILLNEKKPILRGYRLHDANILENAKLRRE